jgi:hypothetical protein
MEKRAMRLKDDNGKWVRAGDTIQFCYGMPPVRVTAKIEERDGQLIGTCSGHDPEIFRLRALRKFVGPWYKVEI